MRKDRRPLPLYRTAIGGKLARGLGTRHVKELFTIATKLKGQAVDISVQATSRYVYHMRMFIASYGVVVGTNYLVVFVLLVIIYYKILKRIKRMRNLHSEGKGGWVGGRERREEMRE